MKFVEYLVPGAKAARMYAERLVGDIPESDFARLPVVNGSQLKINHPAFVLGHLALYPVQLAEMAGISSDGMRLPSTYPDLFKMGVACLDDPDRSVYPGKGELIERYFGATDVLIARIPEIQEAAFDLPLENPARRERFGTVGAFLAYLLLAHPQVHAGQISAWRRCMGLGSV